MLLEAYTENDELKEKQVCLCNVYPFQSKDCHVHMRAQLCVFEGGGACLRVCAFVHVHVRVEFYVSTAHIARDAT